MKKTLTMLLVFVFFMNVCCSFVYANVPPSDERESMDRIIRESYEKMLFEGGYKSADDAVIECEKHFNRNIELPIKLPPVKFSYVFGRCGINTAYNINDHLEIEYVGDGRAVNAKNHFVVVIRPINQKIKGIISKREVVRSYKLEDGTEAEYGTLFRGNVNALVFERKGWQYLLWVDKRIEDKVPAELLVGIANSIGLGNKYKEKPRGVD
jgi:hypothetical protein